MATTPHLLTYAEWLQMPTVEYGREEVVNGEIRLMPPSRFPHTEALRRLYVQLLKRLDENQAWAYDSNLGLVINREPLTCRAPDLVAYHRESLVLLDELFCSAPDLLVEVLSPSETRRIKEEKLADYASIGVPEVWIVSPQAQSVEVQILKGGKFERTAILVDGDLRPTRFPGISIPISTIWPD